MEKRSKLRILIADDHAAVRESLKRLLNDQEEMEIVGEASDGREALQLAQSLRPHIALVDVSMPELNGFRLAEMISATLPEVRVVAFTRHTDRAIVREMLNAGAVGYVLKQSPSAELTRAIRAVAEGGEYIDRAVR